MSNKEPVSSSEPEQTDVHFLDYWRVIKARKEIILAVTLLVVITGTFVTWMLPKIYESACIIRVEQDNMDVDLFNPQQANGYSPYFLLTEYEVIQARPILLEVIRNLNLEKVWGERLTEDGSAIDQDLAYIILKKNLMVSQFRNTSLIAIRTGSESPEEAAMIANEIANVYREHRRSVKHQEMKRGIESLDNELQKQREKVDVAEEELERLRKELGVSILARGVTADKMKLQQLEADRIEYRVDMLGRKARLDQLENLEGNELITASSFVVFDQTLDKIRNQLLDSEVALTLMLENLGENHPDVRRIQAGVAQLRSMLSDALKGLKNGLRADYEVSKAKYMALEQELSLAKESDIDNEREKVLPFEKASRNLMIQRGLLEALSARVAQEGIELEIPMTQVDVVEPGVPASSFSRPNVILNILLSVVAGFALGFGLAFFLEYLDTSVKTVDDVERFLGLPVLGVIPQRVKPLNQEGPESPHAESYRVLRTNLMFAEGGKSGGAFAALSGGVGEGKSTTLFNLAYICASMGDKVLIVDSDLRRPVQHTMLNMSNNFGLTNVLLRDVPIEETIKATDIPNLHFLPSGKLPRNSVGLLDSQRVKELVKNLKARYDYVFFDSPPVMGVSDASIIASELDGVLLVVQYRKYPRAMSARAKRLIESVGGNILGVVLNNINILRDDYYYYYQSYYSHYAGVDSGNEAAESNKGKALAAKTEKF